MSTITETGLDITVIGAIILIAFSLIEIIKLVITVKFRSHQDEDVYKKINEIYEVLCGKNSKLVNGQPKIYVDDSIRNNLEFVAKNTRIIKGIVDKKSTKVRE